MAMTLLSEIGFKSLTRLVAVEAQTTVFLFSPNFEPRSVVGVQRATSSPVILAGDTRWGIMTLQSKYARVEPLEYLKQQIIKYALSVLQDDHHLAPIKSTLSYPEDFSPNQLQNIILELLEGVTQPCNFVVDITALPRRVICQIVRCVERLITSEQIAHVYLFYTWAGSYPGSGQPAEVGALKAVESGQSLGKILQEGKGAEVALFLGRHGSDALQFIEALPADKRVNVFAFLNRSELFRSLEMLRANVPILSSGDTAIGIQYYLSLSSAHNKLLNWAGGCQLHENRTYLVAPFGPKPLLISALAAVDVLRARLKAEGVSGSVCDVALLSTHHYGTTYSVGSGGLSIFHWEPGGEDVEIA